MELSQLFAGREAEIAASQQRLSQLAASEGVPLTIRTTTCNSRRAQELGKWAESIGMGDPFRRAVYHAYFVEGKNIALADELLRIVGSVGLPVAEAEASLQAMSVLCTRAAAVNFGSRVSGLRPLVARAAFIRLSTWFS